MDIFLDPKLIIALIVILAFLYTRWVWHGVSPLWKKQIVAHTTAKSPWQILMSACGHLIKAIVIVVLLMLIFGDTKTVSNLLYLVIKILQKVIDVLQWIIRILE